MEDLLSLQFPDRRVEPAGGWALLPENKGQEKRKPQVQAGH